MMQLHDETTTRGDRMPEVKFAKNGDVAIAYECFGDPSVGKPLLLIMGLDFQMVWWPDEFCERLVGRGYSVVRFDNRDVGLSTKFESARKENAWRALLGGSKAAYSGRDMVDDGIAVMDAVGWNSANVMGASMGAGLAQAVAAVHPNRTRSLISVSGLPMDAGRFEILKYLKFGWFPKMMRIKKATDRDSEIEMLTQILRTMSGGTYAFPEEWARQAAGISYDRGPRDPKSTQRQLSASRAWDIPSITTITLPTVVIAGDADPMLKLNAGRAVANQISGAQYACFAGMGHEFPRELWDDFISLIDSVST